MNIFESIILINVKYSKILTESTTFKLMSTLIQSMFSEFWEDIQITITGIQILTEIKAYAWVYFSGKLFQDGSI